MFFPLIIGRWQYNADIHGISETVSRSPPQKRPLLRMSTIIVDFLVDRGIQSNCRDFDVIMATKRIFTIAEALPRLVADYDNEYISSDNSDCHS